MNFSIDIGLLKIGLASKYSSTTSAHNFDPRYVLSPESQVN
ncbi:hypothetical protein N9T24_01050 [Flavobacteriaceae bacterium]|nr:hypothetical protein [Flavobacteriaceae bacterium]